MRHTGKLALILAGVGGAIAYQQIKNGNLKKMITNMRNREIKAVDHLEDMM